MYLRVTFSTCTYPTHMKWKYTLCFIKLPSQFRIYDLQEISCIKTCNLNSLLKDNTICFKPEVIAPYIFTKEFK